MEGLNVEGSEFFLEYFDEGEMEGNESCGSGGAKEEAVGSGSASGSPQEREELDAKAWLKRRREQIARASKKAREKRRLKVSELQEENDRLREERATFLNKIEDLQLKVAEMRTCGQVDVKLENELLRAQLEEHKRFLSGCFKLHHGIPSSARTIQNLHEQGSSFAETFVHSLISRSASEQWKPIEFRPDYFKTLVPGLNITGTYKIMNSPSNCMHARLDIALTGVSIDTVQEVYWSLWTDPVNVKKLYDIDYPFQLTRLPLPVPEDMAGNFGTMCYVEQKQPGESSEWVFLVSRKRQTLAKSTLNVAKENTPGLCRGKTQQEEEKVPVEQKRKRRRTKAAEKKKENATIGTFGKAPAWILARSTTQHAPTEKSECLQRITGLVMEGMVAWEQGIINEDEELEASFYDADDNEQLVEKEMCTRLAVVVSIPKTVGFGILGGYDDLVNPSTDVFTEKWSKVFDEVAASCLVFEEKKKLAQRSDPLTKAYEKIMTNHPSNSATPVGNSTTTSNGTSKKKSRVKKEPK